MPSDAVEGSAEISGTTLEEIWRVIGDSCPTECLAECPEEATSQCKTAADTMLKLGDMGNLLNVRWASGEPCIMSQAL